MMSNLHTLSHDMLYRGYIEHIMDA